jgi:hypothetical protein
MISVQQDRNFATRIKLKKPTFVLKQFQSENVFSVSKVLFELNPLKKKKPISMNHKIMNSTAWLVKGLYLFEVRQID